MRSLASVLLLPLLCGSLVVPALAQGRLRAAVLEHQDRWTGGALGARKMLGAAGFELEELRPESLGRVQLVVFASFVNNAEPYQRFVEKHARALRRFVSEGGVVLELAQSDQFGAKVSYLPSGCEVRRGDRDFAELRARLPKHTLLQPDWIQAKGVFSLSCLGGNEVSWETLERWTGGQVLLSAGKRGDRYAALVELEHGKGRFLVSSLWLDKLVPTDGQATAPDSQQAAALDFGKALHRYVGRVRAGKEPAVVAALPEPELPIGPLLGHVGEGEAFVWMRPAGEGRYTLHVHGEDAPAPVNAEARTENDRCLVWHVQGLRADTEYRYEVFAGDKCVVSGPACRFRTAPFAEAPSRTKLAFVSCAPTGPSSAWSAIELAGAQGLVLLGDTPYVDTVDLDLAREKHRRFLESPELARLGRSLPIWGTWDDHDFGRNDSDGRLAGKEHTRRAFVEYRALASYGHDGQGIYTSFRRGGVEVFLLDARWFARTAKVAVGDERWTLLGDRQWDWLERGLKASDAPFKIVATGMIWDDKENSESDDWGSYPHERERLERFIGDEKVSGVLLMGGDIHVSRHLRYPDTRNRAGYVLDQLIVSPLHSGVIPSLDVEHPALLWSVRLPHVFLTLDCDTTGDDPVLRAEWRQDIGRGAGRLLRRVEWRASQLRH